MGRCDLYDASAVCGVNVAICNDRNFFVKNGEKYFGADKLFVAFIVRVHCYGHVAKHRFGAGCGYNNFTYLVESRIGNFPQLGLLFFVQHLYIRETSVMFCTVADNLFATVDKTVVPQSLKRIIYSVNHFSVEGKYEVTPAHPCPECAQL